MDILTPKKQRVNDKAPEIQRFLLFLAVVDLKPIDIANKTDYSERTINNLIWHDMPITGQLLRELHLKFNLSLDWLLSGKGEMFLDHDNHADEPSGHYAANKAVDARGIRMRAFIDQFMSVASEDERVWLEMQLKLHVPQYLKFLERHHDK